uniref:Ubiquitin-specific peptidase-like protein 1 n=1 Tax=Callorhinchus milii TaxID=7868 RepID=V9K9T6_CALMI
MVSPWLSVADKQKTWTGLPLIGQGTDINVSSIHMVGYLGKAAENLSPSVGESCPVCAAKGRKQHLRTFCISWKESILLCENPQCIFPLGSKPLNEILISSVRSPQPSACRLKRQKISNSVDNRDTWSGFNVTTKKSASEPLERNSSSTDTLVSCTEKDPQFSVLSSQSSHGVFVPEKPTPVVPGQFSCKRKELPTETEICAETKSEVPAKGSSPESFHLQWKNKSALCWLDCILTTLVHLKSIRKAIRNLGTEVESPVNRLCVEYDRACGLLSYSKGGKGNGVRGVSGKMMCQVEYILNEIRESIFLLLQPRLKCELGKHDSPVFALPLLLKADPYIEELFVATYTYSFECDKCGYKNVERHAKTLPTVTNLLPDWHPLNGFLVSPCNKCQDISQRRKMILNQLPSIFMLHFVNGLPHADLDSYGFCFEGISYKICAIIQYIQTKQHFVSWIQNSDESWLECDDLKGSNCSRHATLNVPAHEIHIAMWEKDKYGNTTGNQEQALATETTKPNANCVTESTDPDTKSNLLSGLEHLENNTIVTLNLIKVEADSEEKPVTVTPNDEQCHLLTQNNASSQNSSDDHNESVQLCFKVANPNEKCLQGNHTTTAKPDVQPSYILNSEAASCSLSTPQLQLQLTDTDACRYPVSKGRCSKLKVIKVKPATANVRQEKLMQISSEMPVLCPGKQTKAGCVTSPPSNQTLKKTASPDPSLPVTTKRYFGTSWSKNLMDRQISSIASGMSKTILKNHVTSSRSVPVSLKVTDSNRPIKEHFDGFKIKGLAKCAGKATKMVPKDFSNVQNTCNLLEHFGGIKENNKELLPMKISSVVHTSNKMHQPSVPPSNHVQPTVYQTEHSSVELWGSTSGKKEFLNTDTKPQKLRLKLLKKLQVKKDRLAALDQQMKTKHCAKNVNSTTRMLSNIPNNTGSRMFHDVLNELCHQLGVEDHDSICTSSSSASVSSSSSNDDIFAELFSPTSTASTYEDDIGYNDLSTGIQEVKCAEVINSSLPAKENILGDLLSTTTLNSFTGGPEEELLHFDEKLFENC